jgi:tetratricopeptide (TPR) repeat protein
MTRLKRIGIILSLIIVITIQAFIWRFCAADSIYSGAAKGIIAPESSEARVKYYRQIYAELNTAAGLNPLDGRYPFLLGQKLLEAAQDEKVAPLRSLILEKGDILAAAKNNCLRAVTLEPGNARYHLELARAYLLTGETRKGEEELRKVQDLGKTDAWLYYDLARSYLKHLGGSAAAQTDILYKEALKLADSATRLKMLQGLYGEYTTHYGHLSRLVPLTVDARYAFAEFLKDKKLYKESIREFTRAFTLADRKTNAELRANSLIWIGVIYLWKKKPDIAAGYFEKALQIEPNNIWALNNLGFSYYYLDRSGEAEETLRESIRKAPGNSGAYFYLGLLYEKLSRKDSARESYEQALRYSPDEATAENILQRLEQLE